ncbi:MAG: hypothetical protein EA398_02605 [Deltaproteobacteria bacterium]|nr:MAG: hypothetical protein EA398_02605 [Deltaproteobacteria bacterium]
MEGWPAALLSVSGTADDDVWVVGAAVDGEATVLHWDGVGWGAVSTGFEGDLWWVHALPGGTVYMAGESAVVLRLRDGVVERIPTPGLGRHTLFGLFARGEGDVFVTGGIGARGGVVWHWDGVQWRDLPLPLDAPTLPHGDTAAVLKPWGDADGTMRFVGGRGAVYGLDGDGALELLGRAGEGTLFTVAGTPDGGDVLAVGEAWSEDGPAGGFVVDALDAAESATLPETLLLQGVAFGPDGTAWASGTLGHVTWRDAQGSWTPVPHGRQLDVESLHAVWVSPSGQVWSVGGNVLSSRLDAGVVLHGADPRLDAAPATLPPPVPTPPDMECPPEVIDAGRGGSIARRWNEQTLHAIRRAFPEPTVHARNLYHLSVALHDAFVAYSADHSGLVHDEAATVGGTAARASTMSHAAYRLLVHRYAGREGGEVSVACFRAVLEDLGHDPALDDLEADTPASLGLRIGQAVIDYFASDGARERTDYDDPTYRFANPPLYVDDPGIDVDDPSTWQPLDIARAVTQNGIPEPAGPQLYIGPHWGGVTPFAIRRPDFDVPYFALGERPRVDSAEMADWVVDVLRRTAWLDIDDGATLDISPGAYGNNPLGEDSGTGHPVNPATGEPYAPQVVLRGDFGRVLAEYWADGPDSETPPGHWNTIAHRAFDHPDFEHRFYGEGPVVDRLTWDVWTLLLLNGALHDAAIVAWEAKRLYETARPSTLIRWMAANGQRTDPALPAWHPDGLPLVDGLIELVTEGSAAPGERHAHLRRHVGEVAVWTWPGEPSDEANQRSPMRWIRGVEWKPYQPRTFVNPAFPGYVSGHSTFSRAAAVVLDRITGSPWFPGGLGEFVARENGYLEFEQGPSTEVRLQWGTWYDAADQAGQSRIWGGIHVVPDDYDGRRLGQRVGEEAAEWGINRILGIAPLPGIGDPANPIHGGLPDDEEPSDANAPPTSDPGVVVGTGRTGWEPLLQRQPLRWERGTQGGFHVWLTLRVDHAVLDALDDDARAGLSTAFTVTGDDGTLLASAGRTGGYRRTAEGWELVGTFAILRSSAHPSNLSGRFLDVEAALSLPDDDTRRSTVTVLSACCD